MTDPSLDYLAHLATESDRFAAALAAADPAARVPSCPDWAADDLLWHLGEVQWFWGTIVRDRLQDPSAAEEGKPDRPATTEALTGWFAEVSRDLGLHLAATAPETQVWTWADDHTVGFIRRRQAHEALIHRVDAELTAGSRTPMDPALSSDGVDEVMRVMYGGAPAWGEFTPEEKSTVRIVATDTGQTWVATLGWFVGTDPDGGQLVDDSDLRVAATDDGSAVAAEIRGTAADLDCWLWHRPPVGEIEQTGDPDVLAAFATTIAPGIN